MKKSHRRGNVAVHVKEIKEIEAINTEAGYVFVFTGTEACFLRDGLNVLVEGYEDWERLEDGEKDVPNLHNPQEVEFAKKLSTRIGKRLGVE